MYSLTIAFGPVGMSWRLLYNSEETARAAYAGLGKDGSDKVLLIDDFGQCACIALNGIHGVMLEDLQKSMLAQIELALHQTRTQIKGEETAASDQVIKNARFRQGSPAIVSAMGGIPHNGRFNG